MLGILALCTVAGYFFWWLGFNVNNIIMIYILGVLAVSMATTAAVTVWFLPCFLS